MELYSMTDLRDRNLRISGIAGAAEEVCAIALQPWDSSHAHTVHTCDVHDVGSTYGLSLPSDSACQALTEEERNCMTVAVQQTPGRVHLSDSDAHPLPEASQGYVNSKGIAYTSDIVKVSWRVASFSAVPDIGD